MDPNLFHIDWERLVEVMVGIIVLSFFIERALALLFESRVYIEKAQGKGLKELIALVVSVLVCWYWNFDAISMIFLKAHVTFLGMVVTGAIVAGGSKASIKLFRDIMGIQSTAASLKAKVKTENT